MIRPIGLGRPKTGDERTSPLGQTMRLANSAVPAMVTEQFGIQHIDAEAD